MENAWLLRGGETGRLMAAPEFSAAGLGPPSQWPTALRWALRSVLESRQAQFLAWGPQLAFLYNDAYVPVFAERHPAALGRPFAEVWADIWPQFGPIVSATVSGEPQRFTELHIPMLRGGELRDTWFNFTYTPLRDENDAIAGLICEATEVTDYVQARGREHEALARLTARTRALSIVNRTGAQVTAETDVGRLTQTITDAGVELTGAEFGAFFYNVIDPMGERYTLYTLSGVERSAFERFPMPRNTAVFAPTFNGESVVRSDDITRDPRYGHNAPHRGMPQGHLPVRSYLAVPVRSRGGEVIGGLFFGHSQTAQFSEEAEASLVSLASQAAISIDNARLWHEAGHEIARRRAAEEELTQLNQQLEARVEAESAERRQAEAALQQAQKMEAIGKLTGGVAHDFNNLLQVVSGNLQLLTRDVAGNVRAERRIANAQMAADRGAKLAGQLLAFGRRQPLEPRAVNLRRLVLGMDDMLRRSLGEAVEIETRIAEGLWNTFVDPGQVENAVLNLAINARDAMNGAGQLTIEASNASTDDGLVAHHPDIAPGQYVLLAVSDTGCGMSEEVMSRAFEPFYSTKREGRGSGLGLSMVYGFVKQSGGHVKLYSEPGQGTTVKLYLPRAYQADDALRPGNTSPLARGGSETILVAEDDELVRATVAETLKQLGYGVIEARDASEALALIEQGQAVDLLFTDVVMPGPLRSPELARMAVSLRPGLRVLFTSGYTENAIVHGGRLDPGVELISKPYSGEALAKKIRRLLDGE